MTSDDLDLTPLSSAELVSGRSGVLVLHNPGWPAPTHPAPEPELMQRARHIFETWHMLTPPDEGGPDDVSGTDRSASLTDQAVALVLAPYLQHAAQAMSGLDQASWQRPVCPVCGGWPNLALLE